MSAQQSRADLEKQLAEANARADAAEAKAKKAPANGKLTPKVSAKGCMSVYGLGRFPISLYKGQWNRLLEPAQVDALRAFIKTHDSQLASKD